MVEIIILFIIGIYVISVYEYKKWYKWIFPLFINLFLSMLFGMSIAFGVGYFYEKNIEYDTENPIYLQAISNENEMSGTFFLGSGMIKTTSYYYYYKILNNGNYVLSKIPSDNVEIQEQEKCEHPRIIKGYDVLKNGFSYIADCGGDIRYKIIVPKNSVIKKIDFSLNK